MGDIEKIKHLFVSVEERLPDMQGQQIAALACNEYVSKNKEYIVVFRHNEACKFMWDNITHWLDLSILTTKERAIKFAEDAVFNEQLSKDQGYDYINVNQNDL